MSPRPKQQVCAVAAVEAATVGEDGVAVFEQAVAFFGQEVCGAGRALATAVGDTPADAFAGNDAGALGGYDATYGLVAEDKWRRLRARAG